MERKACLDYIRIIACMMVVMMHSPMPLPSAVGGSVFLSAVSYMSSPCIGLFFMVSGALLLPCKSGLRDFLKKRLTKVIVPTIIWTLFYVMVSGRYGQLERQLLSMPFSPQGSGVLWFMYVLVGLYLVTPVLSVWIERASTRAIEFYLALWAVTLCFPLLSLVIDVNESVTGPFYYFSGYIGYYVLGYYMVNRPISMPMSLLSVLFVIAIVVPVVVRFLGIQVDFYRVFWYLSIFVAVMCMFWFRLLMLCGRRSFPLLTLVSNLTFGIYLCHIFIIRNLLWHTGLVSFEAPYPLRCIAVFIVAFTISLLICCIISWLPFGRYIIGYDNTRKHDGKKKN